MDDALIQHSSRRETTSGIANIVRRGPIGIVGSSRTAVRAAACLIDAARSGVSQALATDASDLHDHQGAAATRAALDTVLADPATGVALLIGTTVRTRTRRELLALAGAAAKPVVLCLLGDTGDDVCGSIDTAVVRALVLGGRTVPAEAPAPEMPRLRGRITGLYSSAGLVLEAQGVLESTAVHPSRYDLVDLGDDEHRRNHPHPALDSYLRDQAIRDAGEDPDVRIVLLDVVLGRGAPADPAGDLVHAIRAALDAHTMRNAELRILCSVIGTERDPQRRSRQEATLRAVGAHVLPSTAAVARMAGRMTA